MDNEYSINNAQIYKVMYTSKGNLISCGFDRKIKIWELKMENIKIFKLLIIIIIM